VKLRGLGLTVVKTLKFLLGVTGIAVLEFVKIWFIYALLFTE